MALGANGQELPPLKNFYPEDYQGENQNWDISQSPEKIVYVANSKGLLEFNGASWQLYPSPNETIMRSVKVVGDRIYTGCFMEFGYWKKSNLGTLDYRSLSKELNVDLIEDEEFWNIIDVDNYIIFQSLKQIYILDINSETINKISGDGVITKIFKINSSIYFQRMGIGIFKIESGKDFLVLDDARVRNDEVINLFGSENELFVLSKSNGFYLLKDNILKEAKNFPNAYLSKLSLYDAIQLRDDSFALGSISNGLLYLNANGTLEYQINQDAGLSNNTVLSLFEDVDANLWTGLDYGVSYVNLKAPYKVFNDTKGILGSVYAAAVHAENLYLGTNQGLFFRKLDADQGFKFIEGTQGQVWSLKEIDGKLFCGHNTGTFEINGNAAIKIADVQGTWNLSRIPNREDLLLQGNYDGLYVLAKSGTSWRVRNKIEGFDNSSRYFEIRKNKVFVNHEYNGVFKVELDDSMLRAEKVYKDTTIKGANSGIVSYNDKLLYAYKKGIFQYQDNTQKFIKENALSNLFSQEEYESGKLIVPEGDNKLWIFNKSNISYVEPAELTNTSNIEVIPLTKEVRDGILGYENIIPLNDDGTYLIGKTSGYIIFNVNEIKSEDFNIHFGTIRNTSNTVERILKHEIEGDFENTANHFLFSFYSPVYNKYLTTQYQYRLKGIYDEWSEWSKKSDVVFENLPFGDYVFELRGRIGNNLSKNTATYSFRIAKPWYISNVAIVLFLIGVLLFSFFMHNVYKHYYKRQRSKLIVQNKRELELTEVKNEKEIIRIKNEKLEIENKSKRKELAASTMSIIRKNELLTKIKELLNAVGNTGNGINKVISVIDKNLNENDDWDMFQEAFNNSDSEFLGKLKAAHPELSPNDLKLCAYLRLNLSSKEIAQLLNITIKSVEIKRYRLRKKMGLRHEENLVNYILAF